MKTPEEQIQKIIDDADAAFDKHGYSVSNRQYLKENQRCEFLKVHLKDAIETIEIMEIVGGANNEFYQKVLEIKLK